MRSGFVVLTMVMTSSVFAQSATGLHSALTAESSRLAAWGSDPVIVEAVRQQNAGAMALDEVQRIDREWIAGGQEELKKKLTTGACAGRIRELAEAGVHREIFVTDAVGAIVCANAVTSDYWQGDEAKFTQAFKGSKGAVFIDRPRFDESAAATLAQISVPVMDGVSAIGVVVVGVLVDGLSRR